MARKKSTRGNAMLEFAMAFMVIFPVFAGTFQFGYTFYVYNLLQTQVRDGARYAALRQFRSLDATSVGKYKAAVRNMVRTSTPDGSGALIVPGLKDNNIVVTITDAAGVSADAEHAPARVSVSISNFVVDAVVKKFTLNRKPFLEFQYAGRYAPAESEP